MKTHASNHPILRGAVLSLLALGVVVALLAAGVRWHEPLARWVGSSDAIASSTTAPTSAAGKQLWTCGMHPQVIQDHPGDCPICHMKLTPLAQDDAGGGPSSAGSVRIDPVVVQNMGVRVATVTRGPLTRTIRAVGYLAEAQPLIYDVNLRVSGWIEKLHANTEGQHVERGEPLFDLYSPELQVAVQELIATSKSNAENGAATTVSADDLAADTTRTLRESARAKLTQWGVSAEQVDELSKLDQAPRTVTFLSQATGDVTMKNVVEGAAVKAGDQVLRIVDRSTVWLEAQVYEQDLALVGVGRPVAATVDALPGRSFEGKIAFVYPVVDPTTRTATIRIELPNPELTLRPGLYATVELAATLADDATLVPREAVIDTGTRAITFVSVGGGRFEPRELKLGAGGGGMVRVLSGVAPGETVVVSGQFLLDAESRMKEAIRRHLDGQLLSNQAPPAAAGAATMPMPSEIPGVSMPATQAAGALAWSPDVDAVYAAYLDLARRFVGATEPLDAGALTTAAGRLADVTRGPGAALPRAVRDSAAALAGQSIKEQRKSFKAVGASVIAMADVCPPSKAVGGGGADKLVVIHCPMVNADWLQTTETVANPYMPTMRECGEVKRTIAATAESKR